MSTVDGKTIAEAYIQRIDLSSGKRAAMVKQNGTWSDISWHTIHKTVIGLFHSLDKLGIKKGDRVAILSSSRLQWHMADLANLCSGIITVPIYQSNIAEDVSYILEHCGAKLIYAEDDTQILKLGEATKIKPISIPIVGITKIAVKVPGLNVTDWESFSKTPEDPEIDEKFRKTTKTLTSTDIASIVYTSGTTGKPKGVVLNHQNIAAELRAIIQSFSIGENDTSLTFLPFAHILARVESFLPIYSGMTMAFAEKIETVPQNIQEIGPTILVSVPRIYEKIYTKIKSEVKSGPAFNQKVFEWATEVGREYARLKSDHKTIPISLLLKYQIADQLVFSKIRQKLGGKIRISVSGGAPLSAELCEFFHACGIKIVEGYGLTETTAAITVNRPDDYSFGTVGKLLGDAEIRIAPDGEILARGPMVFKEYYNAPDATKEVFTGDGWFCTGDIGEITQRGFLKITDRKKELIVTSAGKNIAPQKLENLLKGSHYISQAVILGDKQKYIAALLTLNEAEVMKWAKGQGIPFERYEDLTREPRIISMVQAEVHGVNEHLPSFETIKKFKILPADLTIEAGELTPSLKVKRKVIAQKYKAFIDELFG